MSVLAGDHVKVLVDGYQLTGDSNRITFDDKRQMHDVTVFEDIVHKFISGRQQSNLEHAGYFNPTVAMSHPVLKDGIVNGVVSVFLGANSMPVEGDPAYSLSVLQGHYKTMPEINKGIPFAAKFANRGQRGGWGTIIGAPQNASFSNSQSGVIINNGTQTIHGGAAYLHVVGFGDDTYSFTVEGSASAGFSSPTTLATFTLNGAQLGSERIDIVGTIPQYTRWKAIRISTPGGTSTTNIAVSLVRF